MLLVAAADEHCSGSVARLKGTAVERPARERWTFTMELPAGVANGGRFVARVLKHLLRAWGVKCVALRDAEPAPPANNEKTVNP